MRATPAVAALAATLALAGCGGGDARSQVQAKVQEFATAAAAHDYRTICNDVLAPSLLDDLAQVGIRCEQAMRVALSHVTSPRLTVGHITVSGRTASAVALSQATGQGTVLTQVQLVETKKGWRISSLGSAV